MNRLPNNHPLSDWLERAWLQRYLERKLSESEAEWFEMYLLDKPHLIAVLEADNDLRDGLALAAAAPSGHGGVSPFRSGFGGGASKKPRGPAMAWAASVVAACGLGLLLAGPLSIGAGGQRAQIIASPERVVFDTLRGVDSPPLVYPGAAASSHVLVDVGLPPDAEHVTLYLAGQAPLALKVSPDGFASFLLPRAAVGKSPAPRIEYRRGGAVTSRTLDIPADH
ncbi:MAG: hypothetical protein CVV05_19525 [Gammaproteobacteria bacterium HGW-Gammaproteobacteria-1]|nr:MAG: hypothetical protein CVV12_03300 [Gammaproteobacteria bacterium HGW-Gammaproteobacteria-2]PKM42117.1 MAG: hypothetical protein CVV05_19525 [Gammaproteobacteria bacterium HGW-Gammaproteobacteria-1]